MRRRKERTSGAVMKAFARRPLPQPELTLQTMALEELIEETAFIGNDSLISWFLLLSSNALILETTANCQRFTGECFFLHSIGCPSLAFIIPSSRSWRLLSSSYKTRIIHAESVPFMSLPFLSPDYSAFPFILWLPWSMPSAPWSKQWLRIDGQEIRTWERMDRANRASYRRDVGWNRNQETATTDFLFIIRLPGECHWRQPQERNG